MNDAQWDTLLSVIRGDRPPVPPVGFIIDSPWLPNWAGFKILDYFVDNKIFLEANFKALTTFPQAIFFPGFWLEYGMCTEPSAFGSVPVWEENEFPFAKRTLRTAADVDDLEPPNPRKDGLLPFVIRRLRSLQPDIERAGHRIRFATARGPLNIASFLMGTSEFLTALKTDPDRMRRLLSVITDFLVEWVALQRECFPSIDGILLLDDIVGFVGRQDFETFAFPCLKRIFSADVSVKFFHNDAPCKVCAPLLPEAGVNLLNFGPQHTLGEMRRWTGNRITLVGNIHPRDVLANGSPSEVTEAVTAMLNALEDPSRLIVSCGGGMPPGAPTENIKALIAATEKWRSAHS